MSQFESETVKKESSQRTWGPLVIGNKKEVQTTIGVNSNFQGRKAVSDEMHWDSMNLSAGFLNLRDLNTLLLKYIGVVHELEEGQSGGELSSSVTEINIDETEVASLDKKYQVEMESWKNLWKDSEKKIGDLKKKIAILEEEKKKLEKRGVENDAAIKEREETIKKLKLEISELQAKLGDFLSQSEIFGAELNRLHAELGHLVGELNSYKSLGENEIMRNNDLRDRKATLEQELKFKISLLESELGSKRDKTSIDTSSMEVKTKGEFAARLKVELSMLRSAFEEAMVQNRERFELQYRTRITELELEMSLAISQQVSVADMEMIKAQVKELETNIGQLTGKNQNLAQSWSRLTVKLKQMEVAFNNKMTEKERRMIHMKSENMRIKKLYEELSNQMMMTKVEVGVYGKLLSPEVDRITTRHSDQFSLTVVE